MVLFFIQVILFIFASIICFTIPGLFLLKKIELNFWEKLILGTVVGFVGFSFISYILLIFKLHFLLIFIIGILDILCFKSFLSFFKDFSIKLSTFSLATLLIFLLGILGQLAVIAPSGLLTNDGLIFWSAHGHDGTWHIALAEELQKGTPLQNPVFAGEKLVNYHFFADITLADFNSIFKISLLDLYFRFFPALFSVLLGGSAYLLGKRLGGSDATGLWAVIFTYFVGSFGFVVTLLQQRGIGGESIFWATQIQSSVGNPPQIISDFIILTFFYFLNIFIIKRNIYLLIICSLLAGSLAVFKIYASVVILSALFIAAIWQIIQKRSFWLLILAGACSLLSAALYLPHSQSSISFLIFEPWWFIRTMVVADSRLNLLDWELKRQTYISDENWKRVIQLEMTAFLIFFFGNLGMRFLGLIEFIGRSKSYLTNYFNQIFLTTAIVSLILPLLFLQKGVASNTSQFLQYFILIFGILAGISTAQILGKIRFSLARVIIIFLIIILSIPTQLGLLNEFYNRKPITKITHNEIGALTFLRKNSASGSIVLTPPYNRYLDLKEDIPNIWDWSDTAYVSALSSRRTFFSDSEQVDIMGYKFAEREKIQKEIFEETDKVNFIAKLKSNKITHLYFPKVLQPKINLQSIQLSKIFSNDQIEIWQIPY